MVTDYKENFRMIKTLIMIFSGLILIKGIYDSVSSVDIQYGLIALVVIEKAIQIGTVWKIESLEDKLEEQPKNRIYECKETIENKNKIQELYEKTGILNGYIGGGKTNNGQEYDIFNVRGIETIEKKDYTVKRMDTVFKNRFIVCSSNVHDKGYHQLMPAIIELSENALINVEEYGILSTKKKEIIDKVHDKIHNGEIKIYQYKE